jgi:3-oxoacyl-[acyl-carrier protein] reductase
MDLQLTGTSAIVTGGSRGLGYAIAQGLVDEGAAVAICARHEGALRDAEQALVARGGRVYAAPCDVGDAASLARFLDAARAFLGGVNILVNNATGYGFQDDEDAWRASLDVDLMATVRASSRVAPWMIEAGGGVIIHLSSIAGVAASGNAPYSAAKAAVISYSKNLAVSLAASRVRVNVVIPGSILIEDGLWDQVRRRDPDRFASVVAGIPSGRMGHASEVADAVVFLCSPRANWITGACLAVDGAQHRGNL